MFDVIGNVETGQAVYAVDNHTVAALECRSWAEWFRKNARGDVVVDERNGLITVTMPPGTSWACAEEHRRFLQIEAPAGIYVAVDIAPGQAQRCPTHRTVIVSGKCGSCAMQARARSDEEQLAAKLGVGQQALHAMTQASNPAQAATVVAQPMAYPPVVHVGVDPARGKDRTGIAFVTREKVEAHVNAMTCAAESEETGIVCPACGAKERRQKQGAVITTMLHADGCRRVHEAPLVALVAAVPEGLDPVGWRAAVLAMAEKGGEQRGRSFLESASQQRDLEATMRTIHDAVMLGKDWIAFRWTAACAAYARALTPAPKVEPFTRRAPGLPADIDWD